jgi:hypothetical protein
MRLQELRVVDPILTTIAHGYSNAELIANKLFPVVQVEKEGGKIPTFGKEAFKIYQTERAIRAQSNQMPNYVFGTTSYTLTEHDLEQAIDYREEEEAFFDQAKRATELTMQGILLGHEKKAADYVQDADNYAAANKEVFTDNYLDDPATDPVAVIEEKKEELRALIGKDPQTLVMGAKVYKALKKHPKLVELIKYSQTGILTHDLLKALFDVQEIIVGKAVSVDEAGAFSDIWGNNIILAYVTNPTGMAASVHEPCYGYTLRKKNQPVVDKYTENGGKVTKIRTTDIYDIKVVGSASAYLLGSVLGYDPEGV